jgi:glycosyl transferase, family 25
MSAAPVYVLNLARSPERRKFMLDTCARAGVVAKFVAAVDGRACHSTRPPRAALSKAETALILTHRKAWRKLLATREGFAVVLEDDVHLGEGFVPLIASDWAGLSFDVIKLETMFHRILVARSGARLGDRWVHRLRSEHVGAAGYIVSREGARKLLRSTRRLDEPVDQTIFGRRAIRHGEVVVYQIDPAIVVQDNLRPGGGAGLATTLHEPDRAALAEEARSAKPRGGQRLWREAARLWMQFADAARARTTCRRLRPEWR